MRFCPLASGSSGNSIYIGTDTTHIIVDMGLSCRRTEEALRSLGIDPCSIDAVLVTHDHSDHTQGIPVFCKKHGTPVYATKATLGFLKGHPSSRFCDGQLCIVTPDKPFTVGDIVIEPFRISHDALDPVSFVLSSGGRKLGMATDLGVFTSYTVEKLGGCDALYIEANHDLNMLLAGPYPYSLKQRIHSEFGHLSNDDASDLIRAVRTSSLKNIVLAHLSLDNNFEDLAYETVRLSLEEDNRGLPMPDLFVANRYTPTGMINV